MITMTQLEYLLAVDRVRHFGKAAKESFITQPTLSMQIQRLEEELDVVIFDRSKKPIQVTQEGKRVIEQARLAYHEFKRLESVAREGKGEASGPYSLGVIPTLAPYLIPLFLRTFAESCPKVDLHIEEMQTSLIVEALQNEKLDAAILATPLDESRLTEEVLFYEPFHVYASARHPLAKRRSVQEADLDGNDLWLLTEGHCLRNQIVRVCSLKKTDHSVFRNVRFESGTLETLMNLVEQSGGYTLIPALTLAHHKRQGKLRASTVPFVRPVPVREVSFVTARNTKRPIHEALKAHIRKALPEDLPLTRQKAIEVVGIS